MSLYSCFVLFVTNTRDIIAKWVEVGGGKRWWWVCCAFSLLLWGCQTAPVVEEDGRGDVLIAGQAVITAVEPVVNVVSGEWQVEVGIEGELRDDCTEVERVMTRRTETVFELNLVLMRPVDCEAGGIGVVEEALLLDVQNLEAGIYEVAVGDMVASFELPDLSTATPEPLGRIGGTVWYDVCQVVVGADDEWEVGDGCVQNVAREVGANRLPGDEDDEPLRDWLVAVLAGPCQEGGEVVATVITDDEGGYEIIGLQDGVYCVGVVDSPVMTGTWQVPAVGVKAVTVLIQPGAQATQVDFGWGTGERWPLAGSSGATVVVTEPTAVAGPTVTPRPPCRDEATFVGDMTLPDNSRVAVGAEVTKVWRLRNAGTCTWGPGYTAVWVGGEQLGGEETGLTETVLPGEMVDVRVGLVMPTEVGNYRGEWKLRNPEGALFGIEGGQGAFWLQVVVVAAEAAEVTTGETTGSVAGRVWHDICFVVGEPAVPTDGCVLMEVESVDIYRANGVVERNEPGIGEVLVTLGHGACPSPLIAATTKTGGDGRYRFDDVRPGEYCVMVDTTLATNGERLLPGGWTWPALGVGLTTVMVASGEVREGVDFGWDFDLR
ncbi:MAG TPA: NBR1-Ig-like domain-containing protein [Anaerolineae bacterium]|nr:NBR1-Ig-like domain-containing protein [Anaerolineae bacterium]